MESSTQQEEIVYLRNINCLVPNCEYYAECEVHDIDGKVRHYCKNHIPSDAPIQCDIAVKCTHEGCIFAATEALPRPKVATLRLNATYCFLHSPNDYIHSVNMCIYPGCRKQTHFGSMKLPQACEYHVISNMHAIGGFCLCGKCATHNVPNATGGGCFCAACANQIAPGAFINVRGSHCKYPGCNKKPTYCMPGSNLTIYCAEHGALNNAQRTSRKNCMYPGCTIFGSYTILNDHNERILYCAAHCALICPTHEAKSTISYCEYVSPEGTRCSTCASYNMPGETKKRFCAVHAPTGMHNVSANYCACGTMPTFNFSGLPPRFCMKCRQPGMINTSDKLCEYKGCTIRAGFGNQADGIARFCDKHCGSQMVNISNRKCDYLGCNVIATFGYPRGYSPLREDVAAAAPINYTERYCIKHKKPDMVDLHHKTCACGNRAFYHDPNEITCKQCAPPNAISENALCVAQHCDKRAYYGHLFTRAIHCADHAHEVIGSNSYQSEFTDRYPHCDHGNCRARPTYCESMTDALNYPTHCAQHAPLTAHQINPVPARCDKCQKMRVLCAVNHCCAACTYPIKDQVYLRRHKRREEMMSEALRIANICVTSHDKVIRGSVNGLASGLANTYRPDFYFARTYNDQSFAIILEVDEHQHGGALRTTDMTEYTVPLIEAATCDEDIDLQDLGVATRPGYTRDTELTRMIILQRILNVPTLFVRYNPDEYCDNCNVTHQSSRGMARAQIIIDLLNKPDADLRAIIRHDIAIAFAYFDGQQPNHIDIYDVTETSIELMNNE